MFRFFAVCLLLAAVCVTGIVLLGRGVTDLPGAGFGPRGGGSDPGGEVPPPGSDEKGSSLTGGSAASVRKDGGRDPKEVTIEDVPDQGPGTQQFIIPDARVIAMERREVPAERDGVLWLLATPAKPREFVPEDKLIKRDVGLLAVQISPGDEVEPEERITDPESGLPYRDPKTGAEYRRPRITDTFEPGSMTIIRQKLRFRRLAENDEVKKDQLIGVVNPTVALEDVASKRTKVEAAAADVRATSSMKDESKRRLNSIISLRGKIKGAVSDDDLGAAIVTVDRYVNEEIAKRAAVVQAQRELSAAWSTLEMYLIKAPITGKIRTIYRQPGEAVKNLEPVVQIQDPELLRIDAQVDVQDALPLRHRMHEAEKLLKQARELDLDGKRNAADSLRAKASIWLRVNVETSRPDAPKAVLTGHLQEVNCVSFSRHPDPVIISGSEEGYVRIWERRAGSEDHWRERTRLDHAAPVRALAVAKVPDSEKNWLVTATSTGRVRRFEMDHGDNRHKILSQELLKERHQGAIQTVAFTSDGRRFATAGDDRSIFLWDTETGEREAYVKAAHNQPITSLVFTPDGKKLISAGRDKALIIWDVAEDGKSLRQHTPITGRSADVAQLGLDPKGEYILFDEGRELRVLGLNSRHFLGTLSNAGAAGNFSTMALFSPVNGRTILTNGNAPGRLQLWRAPTATTRAAEVRQFLWGTGTVTCGAFDPSGRYAVTGTSDHRVLVWKLPDEVETEKVAQGELTFVEELSDSSTRRVNVRAMMKNPGGVIATSSSAAIIVPPVPR